MLNTITDSFEIWSAARTRKSKGRGRSVDNQSQYGIQKLRELILELAIRGKLVPQNSQDEPATELLKKIAKEKAKLIKEGKLKKIQDLPAITEDDKLFDLPLGWVFFRIGDYLTFEYGKSLPEKVRDITGDVFVYGSNGVVGNHSASLTDEPCIVIGRKGSAGALNKSFGPSWTTDVAFYLIPPIGFDLGFTYLLLRFLHLEKIGKGIKPGINRNEAYNLVTALPPISEQHRIVTKVDELMALCDELEEEQTGSDKAHELLINTLLDALTNVKDNKELQENWQRIENNFDILFTTEQSIDRLKQTILQLAVMGKLVPQDPKDEPASELLKKITKEKERLVEEGKIKKQKPLPAITDEEKPFELPEGWEFVRLGNLLSRIGSGSTPRGGISVYIDEGIPFLRSQNIWNEGLELLDVAYISEEIHQKMSNTIVLPNDILLNITGASLGRCTIYPDGIGEANVSQHVTIIRSINLSIIYYLHLCILSPYTQSLVWGRQVGMAREGLSKKVLELFEIPLPPLEEQHRIVAKVDELFAICDKLKERIKETEEIKVQLADAVVERGVVL